MATTKVDSKEVLYKLKLYFFMAFAVGPYKASLSRCLYNNKFKKFFRECDVPGILVTGQTKNEKLRAENENQFKYHP